MYGGQPMQGQGMLQKKGSNVSTSYPYNGQQQQNRPYQQPMQRPYQQPPQNGAQQPSLMQGGPNQSNQQMGRISTVPNQPNTLVYHGPIGDGSLIRALDPERDPAQPIPKLGDGQFLDALRRRVGPDGVLIINPGPQHPQGQLVVEALSGIRHPEAMGPGQSMSRQMNQSSMNQQGQQQRQGMQQQQTNVQQRSTQMTHHQHDQLVPFDKQQQNKIRINLHSQSPEGQFDNMASVEVDCDNPDAVISRMLEKLTEKFPPDSVVTIEREVTDGKNSKDSKIGSKAPSSGEYPESVAHDMAYRNRAVPDFNKAEVETRQAYAEMPVVEEVEIRVPRREVQYVEKIVPQIRTEYREVVKEVPEIVYNDIYEEVPEYHEVIKHVRVKQYVDKHVENIVYVPKIEVRHIEKEVQVPARDGRVVEVPKPYIVEQQEVVAVFKDTLVPCVVSQKLVPLIQQSSDEIEVEAKKYVPCLVPVDVYIPRPVHVPLIPMRQSPMTEHCPVQVPAAQFNSLLLDINPQLRDEKEKYLPTIRASDGTIPLMPGSEALTLDVEMNPSQVRDMPYMQHVQQNSRPVMMGVNTVGRK